MITSYAIPAAVVSTATILAGRQRQLTWSPWEPALVSLPFLMVYLYVYLTFGGIRAAVIEMEFHPVAVIMIAGLGGVVGGLSLLPRLFYTSNEVPRLMVTLTSAFIVGLMCLKMFFLMAAIANPKALISPG